MIVRENLYEREEAAVMKTDQVRCLRGGSSGSVRCSAARIVDLLDLNEHESIVHVACEHGT